MGPPLRLALAAATLLAIPGCDAGPDRADGATRSAAAVTARDFHIKAPRQVTAGRVRFVVHNAGPDTHELLVVRSDSGRLPLRRDGLTVDEDALGSRVVGNVEGAQPGTSANLDVRLAPGRYVLFCNMTGHYLGGMHTELEVH